MKTLTIILIVVLLIVFVPIAWSMFPGTFTFLLILAVVALMIWGLIAFIRNCVNDTREYMSMKKNKDLPSDFRVVRSDSVATSRQPSASSNPPSASSNSAAANFPLEVLCNNGSAPSVGPFSGAEAVARADDPTHTVSIILHGRTIGRLPSGQQGVHTIILALGGSVPCSGRIVSRPGNDGAPTLLGFVDLQI